MPASDFYGTLGVKRTASAREIQAAYRRLARKFHPDVTGGDKAAEDKFKQIGEAYEVLSDKDKRAAYDKWGEQWMHAQQLERMQAQPGGFASPGGAFRVDFGRDPFRAFEQERAATEDGGFGGIFDRLFRGGGPSAPRRRKGQDIEHTVQVSLAEAATGTTRTVQVQSQESCSVCGGAGALGAASCRECGGTGRRPAGRRLEVKIPPGVETGSKVRLRGKGGAGARGEPPGDVVLLIEVAADPRFERRGTALHTDVPVALGTAVLGGEVEVPTLTGRVVLRIPEGTQNGRVFRLAGKGMPGLNQARSGDLFAKLRVVLPEQLSDEQRTLFERLQALERRDGSANLRRQAADHVADPDERE